MADRTVVPRLSGPSERRAPLPSLTGLRFFAAMLVFLVHTSLLSDPIRPTVPISFFADQDIAEPLADFFRPAGGIGVSFFFVLSGFVLTWSSVPGERVTAFWRRRALKIYPNHIVTWALVMWLFAAEYTPLHAWLANLFLVHSFIDRPDTWASVNGPAWTLCSEMFFYALFPLFILLVRRIAERWLWLSAAGMVAGIAGVTLVTRFIPGGSTTPLFNLTMDQQWFSYAFPPPRLFEFVLGMILARIVAAGLWPRIGLLPSLAVFAAGYWAAIAAPDPYDFSLTTIVPVGMILCAAASADLRGAGGWLGGRTMVWLGNVSFGFYLVQGLVIFYGRPEVLGGRTFGTAAAIGLLIALFLVDLLAGWLLYSLVEQPVMRRWGRSRKRPAPEVPRSRGPVPTGETV
ncbi:acyltransferase family protein [Streptomyces hokutonensis]|uniref:acyltransferase family protein n=1 Tax=Streptomyces hokutonensis TaxID=1306990 RepID=UPI000685BE3B|nr:acyltransferase [Streptomyces hokutonensis]